VAARQPSAATADHDRRPADVTELSVYVRASELESAFARLVTEGFVELVDGARVAGHVGLTPAAKRPGGLRGIKIRAMTEIRTLLRGRLAPMADLLVAEINGCSTARAARQAPQARGRADPGHGPDGVELARRIGAS